MMILRVFFVYLQVFDDRKRWSRENVEIKIYLIIDFIYRGRESGWTVQSRYF